MMLRLEVRRAAESQVKLTGLAHLGVRRVLLGHEEAQLHAERRQQRHDRRAGRHPFADIEEGVLDQPVLGRGRHQVVEPLPRLVEVGLVLVDHRLGGGDLVGPRGERRSTFSWAASEFCRMRSWRICDSALS